MFCKNCGKELTDGAAFCAACGTRAQPVSEPISAAPETPISGQSTTEPTPSAEPVQTAAPQPETSVYAAPAQPEVQPAAAKKPVYKKWWFYTAIAAAAAVIFAAITIWVNSPIGTWKIYELESDGKRYTLSEFEKLPTLTDDPNWESEFENIRLEFKSNGKARLSTGYNTATLNWKETDDGLLIEMYGDEVECKIDNGILRMGDGSGGIMYFKKAWKF